MVYMRYWYSTISTECLHDTMKNLPVLKTGLICTVEHSCESDLNYLLTGMRKYKDETTPHCKGRKNSVFSVYSD